MCEPPLHNGRVTFVDNQIVAVGTAPITGEIDLGDVALLPGWVNAHAHLELSDLVQPLGSPGMPLPQWIGEVLRHRAVSLASKSPSDLSSEKECPVAKGLRECDAEGVRMVVDIRQPTESSRPAPTSACLRWSLLEVIGIEVDRARETLRQAASFLNKGSSHGFVGLSPHAPYSTRRESVERAVEIAVRFRAPVAMHLAETEHEEALTMEGKGPFADLLHAIGRWQPEVFPNAMGTNEWIELLANAPRALLVHGNYLTRSNIERLSKHPQMTVVYCPRTHAYFQHSPHPVADLLNAGVRVALGTDSRASNPDLSMRREVEFLLRHRSDLSPEAVLRMATIQGADAMDTLRVGRFAVGCEPGRVVLPTSSHENPWQAIAEGLTQSSP